MGPEKNPFEYIPAGPEAVEKIKEIRSKCAELYELLKKTSKYGCRETSTSITKLQEVSMWANAAIVMNQGE